MIGLGGPGYRGQGCTSTSTANHGNKARRRTQNMASSRLRLPARAACSKVAETFTAAGRAPNSTRLQQHIVGLRYGCSTSMSRLFQQEARHVLDLVAVHSFS